MDAGLIETVTLSQARSLIRSLAHEQSLLLLSPPGVGKSDTVAEAAADVGLPCRSLLGTQIAPEDVSGIPRIIGERSVFCPPRVLLPEKPEKFCLFLDELPACAPDIQKAFYSLLLERRLGEHLLPAGTWVVAAGNRLEDRALVRALSSALINRVTILNIRVDLSEWLKWAREHSVRREVRFYVRQHAEALMRPVPQNPAPFSTPRAWASLARSLDLVEKDKLLSPNICKALCQGRVSKDDAERFAQFFLDGRERRKKPHWDNEGDALLADIGWLAPDLQDRLEAANIWTIQETVTAARATLEEAGVNGKQIRQLGLALQGIGLWMGMSWEETATLIGDRSLAFDLQRKLQMSLAELCLSVRATNCLESEGLTTLRDLVIRSADELLEIRNFGETTLKEVEKKLTELGLKLGMKLPPEGA